MNLCFLPGNLQLAKGAIRIFGKISNPSFFKKCVGKKFELKKMEKKLALKWGKPEWM